MNKFAQKLAVGATLATGAVASFAAGPTAGDLSALTPDMASVLTAVGAVAGVLIGVSLAIKGFKIVRGLIGR